MGKGNRSIIKENPDYLMRGTQSTVVLMTDKELLEITDILKDLCQNDPFVMKKVEALEKKFKTNK